MEHVIKKKHYNNDQGYEFLDQKKSAGDEKANS